MADDNYEIEPDWVDGYTGEQEAKEDHFASLGLTPGTRPCNGEREPDGAVCTGTLTFELGDVQAKCPVCGGWTGRLAPGHEQAVTRREVERLQPEAEAWRSAHKAGGKLLANLLAQGDKDTADVIESYLVAVEHHMAGYGFPQVPSQATRVTSPNTPGVGA